MIQKGINIRRFSISNLYPTTKGLFVLLTLFLSFFFDWKFAYLVVVPLCLLLATMDRKLFSYAKKVVLTLVVFVSFIFIFRIILNQDTPTVIMDFGFFVLTEEALLDALNQTKLIIVLSATLILFFETTEIEELMISLQRMNMSHVMSYIFLSTLQLIPEMNKKSKVIMQAQQARGIETEGSMMNRLRAFFPSLGPLIISSIADIEDQAVTLEVRGFSSENAKTTLKEQHQTQVDRSINIGMLVLTVGLLVWRFIG